MTQNTEGGNDPQTIDSYGNIVGRRYGASRWATPRKYECQHDEECDNAAVLHVGDPNNPHNCCAQHGKEWGLE